METARVDHSRRLVRLSDHDAANARCSAQLGRVIVLLNGGSGNVIPAGATSFFEDGSCRRNNSSAWRISVAAKGTRERRIMERTDLRFE